MNEQKEIERLQAALREVRGSLHLALKERSQVREAWRVALARMEAWYRQRELPVCVTEQMKKRRAEEKQPRQKREARHHRGRPRAVPTQVVDPRLVTCPQCQARLGGSVWHACET